MSQFNLLENSNKKIFHKLDEKIPSKETELGCNYNVKTNIATFSLWAPSAFSVDVLIYENSADIEPCLTLEADFNNKNGLWTCVTNEKIINNKKLDGLFYEYKVNNEKGTKFCIDPYSVSMVAYTNNGTAGRSAIIELN